MVRKNATKENSDSERLEALLELRRSISQRRPEFARPESWRLVRLKPNWRKPKGLDNKVRKSKKGFPRRVKIGYRGPVDVRGYHPSGHLDVLVYNPSQLDALVPERDAVRIGGTVGARKRGLIVRRASELGLRVLNPNGLKVIESKK